MTRGLEARGPNREQIEYWDAAAGEKWTLLQEELDARIRALGDLAVERAALAPGESVLDIGCGCGETSLAAAQRVGPEGEVLGVDLSGAMLARAAQRAREAGYDRLRFAHADAQTADLGAASFDAAISRFGVMFFADPVSAFANLRRALRPGARLAFVCWRALADNPWARAPFQAVASVAPPPDDAAPPDPHAPGPFAFADATRVRTILDAAGFASIEVAARDTKIDLAGGEGVDAATRFALSAGPASRLLAEAPEALRARAQDAVRDALAAHAEGPRVPLAAAVWLVSASNPA